VLNGINRIHTGIADHADRSDVLCFGSAVPGSVLVPRGP
jgi:hypothetical protein